MNRRMSAALAATIAAALLIGAVTITSASPPSNVTPTLLTRNTYPAFKVMSYPAGKGMFKAEAKGPVDMLVRQHDYLPGAYTGWHGHSNPVFINVTQGTLTFYEYNDPCHPLVLHAGQGYVDSGRGHQVVNESGAFASEISVIIADVGAPFRHELPPPDVDCGS